jgi:hypothetical protein
MAAASTPSKIAAARPQLLCRERQAKDNDSNFAQTAKASFAHL